MQKEANYSVDWFSGNIPIWNQIFDHFSLKGKENLRFLEIGCFEGRATNYLLDNVLTHESSKIDVVDTFGGSKEESGMKWDENYDFNELYNKFKNNVSNNLDKVTIHRGLSKNVLKNSFSDDTFDFVYIDGSHTAYDVLQDAILVHPLLKSGGVVIFDDFGWKDPNNMDPTNSPELGVNCFFSTHKPFYDVILESYQIGLLKK